MKKQKVAYIHCHTKFSVKDGIADIPDYINKIKDLNKDSEKYEVTGMAITEHSNVYSMTRSRIALENAGLQHIVGCELYHTTDKAHNTKDKEYIKERYHLVVMVKKDNIFNFNKLVSYAGYHKIKVSKEFARADEYAFEKYGKGLIASTACLGGLIPKLIVDGKYEEAKDKAIQYSKYFDELYLEVQPHEVPDQLIVNDALIRMSKETGLPLVMGVDAHYLNKDDRRYYKMLQAINYYSNKDSTEESDFYSHLRSFEELEEYCIKYNIPLGCLTNTQVIADKCQTVLKPKNANGFMPNYPVPLGYTEESYLTKIVHDKVLEISEQHGYLDVSKRLQQADYELNIINKKGFSGYFLIISKWLEWCRQNDIPIGPGRGSAAGSLINHSTGVTKVDPIKYNFIFERFLSIQRDELPDVDSDLGTSSRGKGLEYFEKTYGKEYVSQIITFGAYGIRSIFQEAGKASGMTAEEVTEISKIIPPDKTLDELEDIYNRPQEHEDMSTKDLNICKNAFLKLQEVFDKLPDVYYCVKVLKGIIKNVGVHAGGILISGVPLEGNIPMELSTSDSAVLPVTQIDMEDVHYYNLLKIDALGLTSCDVVKYSMDAIGLSWDWYDSEDYSDEKVYEFLRQGHTQDVFQMGKPTPTRLIKDFYVTSIEGLIAVNSCNRPGPLQVIKSLGKSMVDMYAEGAKAEKEGKPNPNSFGIPEVDELLKDNYCCIVYQEDCMRIGQILAKYDLGSSDSRIRKTICKKRIDKIPEIETEFIYGKTPKIAEYEEVDSDGNKTGKRSNVIVFSKDGKEVINPDYNKLYDDGFRPVPSDVDSKYNNVGCINNGYKDKLEECIKIFDVMRAFGAYCFNKSHSGCYGVLAYKTAWLSYYYPLEFAYACLKAYSNKDKKISCIQNAKKRGVKILQPSINESEIAFGIKKDSECKNDALIFGFSDIDGIGDKAARIIIEERKANGAYKDLEDLIERTINNKSEVVKELCGLNKVGRVNPGVNKGHITSLIKAGAFDEMESNRFTLLNLYNMQLSKNKDKDFVPYDEEAFKKARMHKLALDKETMGFYISEHPLEPFPSADFDTAVDNDWVVFTGIVKKKIAKKTKNNKPYEDVIVEIKDGTEKTVRLWKEQKKLYSKLCKKDAILVFTGNYSVTYDNVSCKKILELETVDNNNSIKDVDLENAKSPIKTLDAPIGVVDSFFDNISTDNEIEKGA